MKSACATRGPVCTHTCPSPIAHRLSIVHCQQPILLPITTRHCYSSLVTCHSTLPVVVLTETSWPHTLRSASFVPRFSTLDSQPLLAFAFARRLSSHCTPQKRSVHAPTFVISSFASPSPSTISPLMPSISFACLPIPVAISRPQLCRRRRCCPVQCQHCSREQARSKLFATPRTLL